MKHLDFIDPTRALCFSGHRPDRLPGKGDPDASEIQPLIAALREELFAAIDRGKATMIHGCMCGWDLICAMQVIEIKSQYPHIQLISVAPYAVHFFSRESCWTPEWVDRAREVFRQHDFGISITEHYRSRIYFERNDELIAHSSELICYHDGGTGGTAYTVARAERKGLTVRNLYGRG